MDGKKLREDNKRLKKENKELKDRLKKVEKEFEEFKAKHAVTVANLQKALKIKEDKKISHKPLGAPKGHKGYTRCVPERVDCVKPLMLKRCPCCNTVLKGGPQEIRSRYVTDILPASKVNVTQYDIPRKYCPKCKKIVEPEVPNVLPRARLGLSLMLLVMYLKVGLRLPAAKVCEYFMTMYDLKISKGGVFVILRQLAKAFGNYYKQLEQFVRLARVKHSDSTSWRVNGKNYFAWVFIAFGIVIYKIKKRNNHKVGLALFGKKQEGNVLVVDRHSAFRTLAEKAGFTLQLCWSHILENSKVLAKDFGKNGGKQVHKKLKEIFAIAESFNHKGTPEIVEQLKGEIYQLTQKHYKSSTVRKFVNNLYYRDVENLFIFVTDPEVDATNNISERELRELIIIRNISKGSRSIKGANTTATLLSIIQTLRLNQKNILTGLQEILNNKNTIPQLQENTSQN
ncbi:MAG: IS66 family transposase [Nanoarchaeota archaeon]|nr:IS66 family transposase [Nanoarchaeota archaeon]MCG2717799.1 IS66 family transposase [Nanoarchaeota archaeon]